MADFEGFSDVSLLYAEKYDLVRQMRQIFASEREQLFDALEAKVVAAPWFDPMRLSVDISGVRLDVRLRRPSSESNLVRIQIYLNASGLGRRSLYSDLWLVTAVPDHALFRRRLVEMVPDETLASMAFARISTPGRERYLIRRDDIPFELETVLDTMFGEVEDLQQLLPHVEQVYLDLENEGWGAEAGQS